MSARKSATWMLWGGVAAVAVAVALGVFVGAVLAPNPRLNSDPPLLSLMFALSSAETTVLALGIGFVGFSPLAFALDRRRLNAPPRRPLARLLFWVGIAAVLVGLASTVIVSWLQSVLTASQTGRDVLTVLGWSLMPLFSRVVPALGALLVPCSVVLRLLEQRQEGAEPVFHGSRPTPQPTSPEGA